MRLAKSTQGPRFRAIYCVKPEQAASSASIRSGQRRARVLTYRWHVPHQYELWKLPIDVTMVTGTGSDMSDHWDYGQRPLPANARFRALDDIDPRDYDLAILHFDENVLAPENTNGVIGAEWGAAFKLFCEQFDLPKVGDLPWHATVSTGNTTPITRAQI